MLDAAATPAARTAASATSAVGGGTRSGAGGGGASLGNAWSNGICGNGNAAKRTSDVATGGGPGWVGVVGVGVGPPGTGWTVPGDVRLGVGFVVDFLLAVAVGSGDGSSGGGGWVGVCCGQIDGGHPPGIGSASATIVGIPPAPAHEAMTIVPASMRVARPSRFKPRADTRRRRGRGRGAMTRTL